MISALMITGKTPHHRRLAEVAVDQFLAQDWPIDDREIVIVNTARDAPWFEHQSRAFPVRELTLYPFKGTLGELRNISMLHAQGNLLLQWDDDDWHHPERIRRQVEAHVPGKPTILRRQYRVDLQSGAWGVLDARHWPMAGIVGTLLHERSRARYPHKKRGEDAEFIRRLPRPTVVDNRPELYVRLYHGHNTWSRRRIMSPVEDADGGAQSFVDEVLWVYRERGL